MREFQSYENYPVYFWMKHSLLMNASCSRISSFTMFCANTYPIGVKVQDCRRRLSGDLRALWENSGHFFMDWVGMVCNLFQGLFVLADVLLSP